MKLSQLRQIIREEAKRALNEGPTLSSDANNLAKKGKDISRQISILQQERASLQTEYEKLALNASKIELNKIESTLKSVFPNAKILNNSSVDGVRVLLKRPDHINAYTDIRTLISNLYSKEQKTGLPISSIKIVDIVYAQHLKTIESFTVVLTQNYKKTALNFPNWSDAMRMAK